jgi:hypothetical protein
VEQTNVQSGTNKHADSHESEQEEKLTVARQFRGTALGRGRTAGAPSTAFSALLFDPADATGELGFEPCWQFEQRANQPLELGYPRFQCALCSGAGGCLGFNDLQSVAGLNVDGLKTVRSLLK